MPPGRQRLTAADGCCWPATPHPLYRIRFTYPEGWAIGLGGDWEQHFYIAEGRCEGVISGRFRGANYPPSAW
jgi:hypothetical protein